MSADDALAGEGRRDRAGGGVTVRGTGSAAAEPDVVVVDLGAEVRAADVGAALAEATGALTRMRSALTAAGVDARAVRTSSTSTWTETTEQGTVRVVARLGLLVTLTDVGAAGPTIGAALEAGGSSAWLGGLRLVVSDPAQAEATAREAAYDDAAAKAAHLAHLAGRSLGDVVWIREDEAGGAAPLRLARTESAAKLDVPVDAGEQSVHAALVVRWAWAAPTA
ncbi:SIMPL domain-containing protein [Cellulomonas massiliensis]|uniref:SIMPL domain-containing protein n=1 Tax=Cellulomonas massiliensis TaxID=1465811 RepID=UPI0003125454|nr:SIMPL domain-containing protein [Cellulomonas massiliensis]